MQLTNTFIVGALQVILSLASGFQADIRADTNRDGIVDVQGASDVEGKDTWTQSRGAIFLPNIGDTDRRCARLLSNSTTNEELDDCHDASDDVQRSPQYLAPLKTVPLRGLSEAAMGSIGTNNFTTQSLVRIFQRKDGEWIFVKPNTTFSSERLRAGLDLGIDARDTRRPGTWDGRVDVHFSVTDGNRTSEDKVTLRVAPVLVHHHRENAQQLVSTVPPLEPGFNNEISSAAIAAGIEAPLYTFAALPMGNPPDPDSWAQDFFEPGYASIPGPNGTSISLRIMIRSPQDSRDTGRVLFTQMRNASIGAIQVLGNHYGTASAMGNLEAIPPYQFSNKSYPAGRIILGGDLDHRNSFILPYMQAQETQDPIILDSSWLFVGHVDEFIQFLPADNERGWVVVVSDPLLGIEMLQDIHAIGRGSMLAFSRENDTETNTVPGHTIDEVLYSEGLVSHSQDYAKRIETNLEILKNETGITEDDIYRLPVVYHQFDGALQVPAANDDPQAQSKVKKDSVDNGERWLPGILKSSRPNADNLVKRQLEDWPGRAVSYWPGMINGVVLSRSQIMVPKPWGPVIDGIDVLEQAAKDLYGSLGYNVTFIEAWGYHSGGGEVHCGTNMLRDASVPWW